MKKTQSKRKLEVQKRTKTYKRYKDEHLLKIKEKAPSDKDSDKNSKTSKDKGGKGDSKLVTEEDKDNSDDEVEIKDQYDIIALFSPFSEKRFEMQYNLKKKDQARAATFGH